MRGMKTMTIEKCSINMHSSNLNLQPSYTRAPNEKYSYHILLTRLIKMKTPLC